MRYRSLDLWRGLACLMVVVDHAAIAFHQSPDAYAEGPIALEGALRQSLIWSTALALGPHLFFAISGYCVASGLDSARRQGISAGRFLLRRVWRIFPPYWCALALLAFMVLAIEAVGLGRLAQSGRTLAIEHPGFLAPAQWLGNLTLTETWRQRGFGGMDAPHVYTRVAWSLCYQEQFYAVCALALLLGGARPQRTLVLMTAAIIGYRIFAWDSGSLHRIDGLFPYYWQEFAAGLMAYWALNTDGTPSTKWKFGGVLAAMAALCGLNGGGESMAAALFALALVLLHPWDASLAAAPWLSPLRALGRRSYSIYLTHLPIVSFGAAGLMELGLESFWLRAGVVVPLVVISAIGFGAVFHRLVERRFMGSGPAGPTPRGSAHPLSPSEDRVCCAAPA